MPPIGVIGNSGGFYKMKNIQINLKMKKILDTIYLKIGMVLNGTNWTNGVNLKTITKTSLANRQYHGSPILQRPLRNKLQATERSIYRVS